MYQPTHEISDFLKKFCENVKAEFEEKKNTLIYKSGNNHYEILEGFD